MAALLTAKHGFRARPAAWLFAVLVAAPGLLYASYLLLFATPQYVSEFRVLVRGASPTRDIGLPQLAGLAAPSHSSENSYAIIQFLEGKEALVDLQQALNLVEIYGNKEVDVFSRFGDRGSSDKLALYMKKKIDAYYENTTNTVVVRASAFDPQSAREVARQALRISERLVNGMSSRSRSDLVSYAERDVEESYRKLSSIRDQMYALRSDRRIIDPQQTAVSTLQRQAQVQSAITAVQAQIVSQRKYLSPDSPVMQALKDRLRALQGSLGSINSEVSPAAPGAGISLAGSMREFESLQSREAFAERQYQDALSGLRTAKEDNVRQSYYLETILKPTLSDTPSYPRFWKEMAKFLVLSLATWAILSFSAKNALERL